MKDGLKTTLLILYLESLTLSDGFCQNRRQLMGMLHDALHPKGRYDVGIEKVSYLDSLKPRWDGNSQAIVYIDIFTAEIWLIRFNSSILIVRDRVELRVAPCAL